MKERLDKFTCEKCGNYIEMKHKSLSKMPSGWGSDYHDKKDKTKPKMFCATCKASYDTEYMNWFSSWLKELETVP